LTHRYSDGCAALDDEHHKPVSVGVSLSTFRVDDIVFVVVNCVDYKNDPYSQGDACSTICCRGDLRPYPAAIGCYDTKVPVSESLCIIAALLLLFVNSVMMILCLSPFISLYRVGHSMQSLQYLTLVRSPFFKEAVTKLDFTR